MGGKWKVGREREQGLVCKTRLFNKIKNIWCRFGENTQCGKHSLHNHEGLNSDPSTDMKGLAVCVCKPSPVRWTQGVKGSLSR